MKDLRDKVVVITGAARGIGLATAKSFSGRGARVVATDVDELALEDIPESVAALRFRVDVTKEEEVVGMIDRCISDAGGLDVVVNNAGVSVSGPAEAIPIEDWQWIVDINMWAHVYAVKASLPHFKRQGSGHLVHVSSAAGIFGAPAAAPYCMTKFAVFGLAESLATSLHGTGIGISVVCPQWVNTDIALHGRVRLAEGASVKPEEVTELSREMMRTTGITPETVAEAIVEAVEEDRFLVLPHPHILELAQKKWADPNWYVGRAAEALKAQGKIFGE